MTHGSGTSELAAQLPSSYIAIRYCVLSYSWCTLSALLTAYGEEVVLWICYVSGTSWDQGNCLISWVFRSSSIEWNVSLQRWPLQSRPSICMVSQGEVRQFSLRTVLFVMVQYCAMWMGNVYCCNSRSIKWIETFGVCYESSIGQGTFYFWDRALVWSSVQSQDCDPTASASLHKCVLPGIAPEWGTCYFFLQELQWMKMLDEIPFASQQIHC